MDFKEKTDFELIEIIEGEYIETFQNSAFDELIGRSNKGKIEKLTKKYHSLKIKELLQNIGIINFEDFDIPKSKILKKSTLIEIFDNEIEIHIKRRKDFYDDRRIY